MAARARGAGRTRSVVRHAFRNSLIPVVTLLGLQFGAVLTGAVITETVFAWPGIGRLTLEAVQAPVLGIALTGTPAPRFRRRSRRPVIARRLNPGGGRESGRVWQASPGQLVCQASVGARCRYRRGG